MKKIFGILAFAAVAFTTFQSFRMVQTATSVIEMSSTTLNIDGEMSGLKGSIFDAGRQPIGSATIKVYEGATELASSTSNADGTFVISRFKPGVHEIKVSKVGYQTASLKSITFAGGKMYSCSVKLEVSAKSTLK